MADLVDMWSSAPRTLDEDLFARPDNQKVFISSKMRGGVLSVERVAAAEAVEQNPNFARAWYWERDADAGPYCSEAVCLGHAATADGLILILGDELTPITRKEYELAYSRGVATYLFVDQRVTQDGPAQRFVDEQRGRRGTTTKGFQNASELQTHVLDALLRYAVAAVRRVNFETAQNRQSGTGA